MPDDANKTPPKADLRATDDSEEGGSANEPLLSANELAHLAGCTPRWVGELEKRGVIRRAKTEGRTALFARPQLDRLRRALAPRATTTEIDGELTAAGFGALEEGEGLVQIVRRFHLSYETAERLQKQHARASGSVVLAPSDVRALNAIQFGDPEAIVRDAPGLMAFVDSIVEELQRRVRSNERLRAEKARLAAELAANARVEAELAARRARTVAPQERKRDDAKETVSPTPAAPTSASSSAATGAAPAATPTARQPESRTTDLPSTLAAVERAIRGQGVVHLSKLDSAGAQLALGRWEVGDEPVARAFEIVLTACGERKDASGGTSYVVRTDEGVLVPFSLA